MTALRKEAIQLMERLPEEHVPSIIKYINVIMVQSEGSVDEPESNGPQKIKALSEIESIIRPVQDIDYDAELAKARDEKYGRIV